MVQNVTASVVLEDYPQKSSSSYNSPCVWVDNNASVFFGFLHAYVDAGATFYVVQKYTGGQLVDEWHVWPPDGFKADTGAFTPSGDTLIGVLTDHATSDPRHIRVLDFAIPGIFAPYAHGEIPAGREGAVIPGGVEGGGMTLQELTDALNSPTSGISVAIDKHIKNNARTAIQAERVLRVDSTADEKYSIMRHEDRDGAYEAIVSYFGPKEAPK